MDLQPNASRIELLARLVKASSQERVNLFGLLGMMSWCNDHIEILVKVSANATPALAIGHYPEVEIPSGSKDTGGRL